MIRRTGGRETWDRLITWDKGQSDSERLAIQILKNEGYQYLDPSHPLGGKDGGKDIVCKKDGLTIIGAVYFPRGQKNFSEVRTKFISDLGGVEKNNACGIVFITNQELTLGERKELLDINKNIVVEIYHLERISSLLNNPINYGLRFEFLDIEFTKEEFLSFQAIRDNEYYERIQGIYLRVDKVLDKLDEATEKLIGYSTGGDSYGVVFVGSPNDNDDLKEIAFTNTGEYPLYEINISIKDIDKQIGLESDFECRINEVTANSACILDYTFDLSGSTEKRYNISYSVRNGWFMQQLRLVKVEGKWLQAARVLKDNNVIFENMEYGLSPEKIRW